jgi:signal transduction histidine kinase
LGEITTRSLSFIRLDLEAKEIDLVELATSALRLHDHQIAKKRISIQTRSSESAVAFVRRGEIYQALTNLLLNAIEVLPHSGRLHVRVSLHGKNASITVADSGPGIPDAMRTTLFESFSSGTVDGNGLGLWIVSEIVHGHGGTIRYRSRRAPGKSGTVFRITLPRRAA